MVTPYYPNQAPWTDKKDWVSPEEPGDLVEADHVNQLYAEVNAMRQDVVTHKANYNNPHQVDKSDVGLSDVTNNKQATKAEFDSHLSKTASQINLGHVKIDGETITASNGVISAQIVDTVTSDKWKWGMEDGIVFLEKVVV